MLQCANLALKESGRVADEPVTYSTSVPGRIAWRSNI